MAAEADWDSSLSASCSPSVDLVCESVTGTAEVVGCLVSLIVVERESEVG